jgi:hypothetical protein
MRAYLVIGIAAAATACAKGGATFDASDQPVADASCGNTCDTDVDGVPDGSDMCPDTPESEPVNSEGCGDSQLDPVLEPDFPPFGLTWTPTGDLGRAGGLTWTYTGITRDDLFHIYWVLCDDPALACGLSLDGPIDNTNESLRPSAPDSDLPNGRLILTNTTNIALADSTLRPLSGRVTITIVDGGGAAIPFDTAANLGVIARSGTHAAEIPATSYTVTAIGEVMDTVSLTWTPYLDYYDAQPTPEVGGGTTVSFGASFYSE